MMDLEPLADRIGLIPRDELPALIGELARMQAQAMARLHAPPVQGETSDAGELLTADDVAERLNVGKQRAYELLRNGTLPAIRIGRQVRIAKGHLDEWIEAGGEEL